MSETAVATATETIAATEAPTEGTQPALTPAENLLADKVEPAEGEKKDGEKPEGEKPEGEKEGDKEPAKYEFKLPDGIEIPAEKLAEVSAVLGEAKVSPETAQKLMDLHAGALKDAIEAPFNAWKSQQEAWQKEVKADPEIGGANFDKMRVATSKLIDQIGGEKLREALIFTGAGNHPAIVKAFWQMSQKLTEGGMVTGQPAAAKSDVVSEMYPSMKPKSE